MPFYPYEYRSSCTVATLRICPPIKLIQPTTVTNDPSKNCIGDDVINAQRQRHREFHQMAIGITSQPPASLSLKSLVSERYSEFA